MEIELEENSFIKNASRHLLSKSKVVRLNNKGRWTVSTVLEPCGFDELYLFIAFQNPRSGKRILRYLLDPFHTMVNTPWWRIIVVFSAVYIAA